MLWRLAITILGGFILKEVFSPKSTSSIGGIPKENVFYDTMIRYRRSDNESNIKRHISRELNSIIADCNTFKIGKTGLGNVRAANYDDFDNLYFLCISSNPNKITELEAHYIDKYFDNQKNENINKGSAGAMSSKDNNYYLYVATT